MVIFLYNGSEVDMPWPFMDLNLLQVDVMVVDASKTSGSRHTLVVDVHWRLGSRYAMIVTQSILYSCWMFVLTDTFIVLTIWATYILTSLSAMSSLFYVKVEPIWQPNKELDAKISDWGSFIWTHTKLEGPVTFFSGSHSRDCKVIDLLGCDALYLVDVHRHSRWISCPHLEGGWPNVAGSRFIWYATGYIQITFSFTLPFCR
jgi:hypothetical protein